MTGYAKLPLIAAHAVPDIRAHIQAIYWLARCAFRGSSHPVAVELGVRSGDSTRALLAACQDAGGRLWSYDIAGDAYHVEDVTRGMGIEWVDDLWTCTEFDSAEVAKMWDHSTVDMVFVDTDHSFETTMKEILAWSRKVRPNGLMAFHDTGLNEPGRDGVASAAREFLATVGGWTWEDNPHVAEGDNGLGVLWRSAP